MFGRWERVGYKSQLETGSLPAIIPHQHFTDKLLWYTQVRSFTTIHSSALHRQTQQNLFEKLLLIMSVVHQPKLRTYQHLKDQLNKIPLYMNRTAAHNHCLYVCFLYLLYKYIRISKYNWLYICVRRSEMVRQPESVPLPPPHMGTHLQVYIVFLIIIMIVGIFIIIVIMIIISIFIIVLLVQTLSSLLSSWSSSPSSFLSFILSSSASS